MDLKKKAQFLKDIFEVYRKHGMSIGHEDTHGAFRIEELSIVNTAWLKESLVIDVLAEHDYDITKAHAAIDRLMRED